MMIFEYENCKAREPLMIARDSHGSHGSGNSNGLVPLKFYVVGVVLHDA